MKDIKCDGSEEFFSRLKNSPEYKQWLKERAYNRYIAYFVMFMAGLEISSVIVSMLYYLETSFNYNMAEARFYFSITETFCGLGQICGGIMIGRYVDRTRNLKRVILLNLLLIMLGNLMYSLPISVYFVIIGRFFCGTNESLQTALGG